MLRGNLAAVKAVDADQRRQISIITYMELLRGSRDKQEVMTIKDLLAESGFTTLPLSESIGHRAAIYMEEYGLKAGVDVADALVAATAVESQLPLCTASNKHYRVIRDLRLQPFRP